MMEHLTLERDDSLAILTMNRGKANALNGDMLTEIREALEELNVNDDVSAVVLASASNAVIVGFKGRFRGHFSAEHA